jgi:organic radical activating enzyme
VAGVIDTDRFSATLRRRGTDRETGQVLITNLRGSEQEQDLSEPANCGGFGRVRHFRQSTSPGWPPNPLPIAPAARALGVAPPEVMRAQVFQNAVCNWRCWYCFVDFPLLAGDPKHSSPLTAAELIDLYLAEAERPPVIDLSGGQPDLVPEWIAWMLAEFRRRGLDVYVWSDDNLSNDYFFSQLTPVERATIEGDERYGKVCCFKGFDDASFAFNTQAAPELFARQFELMRRLLEQTPLDLYCYVTFTSPDADEVARKMSAFVDRLQEIDRHLPLRTVPLEISVFTPVTPRLTDAHRRALAIQNDAVAAWNEELQQRFTAGERAVAMTDVPLRG